MYKRQEIDSQIVPVIEEITGDHNVQMQKIKGTNQVVIKTQTLDLAKREAMNKALVEKFGVNESKTTYNNTKMCIRYRENRGPGIA